VIPGDQLRLEIEFVRTKLDIWVVKGVAKVDGKVVCTADIMSAKRKLP
jgi:3-hydroxyacyl-[acyl-carrier-protein] dehydratase